MSWRYARQRAARRSRKGILRARYPDAKAIRDGASVRGRIIVSGGYPLAVGATRNQAWWAAWAGEQHQRTLEKVRRFVKMYGQGVR